ncbi:AI-2E family transporter [Actinocorallia populi]|uniref:AI-2E family transporter n=1 Tax=Actinocorallia populi TaxID=2079200 RepID=UPI000D0979B9|nr:AI-2E family transporter [Actinocorallia populi]
MPVASPPHRYAPGYILLMGSAAAVVVLAGLRAVSSVAGPFFLALVLTIAVSPLRTRLTRRGLPYLVAALLPLAVVLAGLLAMAVALALSGARLAALIPGYTEELTRNANEAITLLTRFGVTPNEAQKFVSGLDLNRLLPLIQSFMNGLVGALSSVVLVIILLYGMSLDAVGFSRTLERLSADRPELVGALREYAHGTYRYLLVTTVFGVIVAVLDVGVLMWLGVPAPLVWGLLSFITNYIPNVGFVIGLVPPALLAWLESGWGSALWVIALYSVINFVLQSLVQPKYAGDTVGLSLTATLVSLVVWSLVIGPLGAILAVPLSALALALFVDPDPGKHWLRPLLSGH